MIANISTPYLVSFVFVLLIGACIGSFLNLVIYRVPLNLSIVYPRSHCQTCKKNIPILGLIPVLGFFFMYGKCYFCKAKISLIYPLVELFSSVFTLIIYIKFFNEITFLNLIYSNWFNLKIFISFLTALWLFYTGVILSIVDLKHRILPDLITIPGIFFGIFLSCFNSKIGFFNSILGALVGFLGLFLFTKLYELIRKREAMGFGDVKYLAFIGAVVGPSGVFYTLLIASIIGSFIGIIYGFFTKKGLSTSIPFGPFLAVAALFVYIEIIC